MGLSTESQGQAELSMLIPWRDLEAAGRETEYLRTKTGKSSLGWKWRDPLVIYDLMEETPAESSKKERGKNLLKLPLSQLFGCQTL